MLRETLWRPLASNICSEVMTCTWIIFRKMVLNIISDLSVAISQLIIISKGSGNLVLCVLSWVKGMSSFLQEGFWSLPFLVSLSATGAVLVLWSAINWLAGERHLELLLFGHHVMSYNCRSYKMDHNSLPQ